MNYCVGDILLFISTDKKQKRFYRKLKLYQNNIYEIYDIKWLYVYLIDIKSNKIIIISKDLLEDNFKKINKIDLYYRSDKIKRIIKKQRLIKIKKIIFNICTKLGIK